MDMSKYKGMFLTEAREHLGSMNQLVVSLEKEPQDKGTIDSLFRSAHSIKGMAASMGYDDVAELSHKMEDLMDKFRKEAMTVTPEAIDILLEGVDALERLTDAIEQDSAADVDLSGIVERIKGYGESEYNRAGGITLPVKESEAAAEVVVPIAVPTSANQSPTIGFKISIEISQDSPAPSVRAFLIYRKIKEFGEVVSMNPSEADIKGGKFSGQFSASIKTYSAQNTVEEAIMGMGEVSSLKIEPLEIREVSDSEFRVPSSDTPKHESQDSKPETGAPVAAAPLQQTIKVNTTLLDYFVSAIGELIINKSRLHLISKGLPSKELKDGLNQLDRLVRDLHDQVMTVRMMPIESILERFPRVIRDLARKQGKEVELVLEGQDIELDRSILEGLGNPLTHMIRNSIDHGIEPPDERKRLGKPVPAKIRIKASREKDQVFIEVSDDGRGMDPDILKETAVRKGVITPEKAAGMDRKEALMLICLPGFSTAREVSDISGRGVGMDAVKAAIEPLGGSIDIDSQPGAGTRITLRLPLTVAIIQSLLIEATNETFAIPISRVLRTLEVERVNIKMSQKQRLIDFDGSLIPLLSLRKILKMPPLSTQEKFIYVVVTEIKGKIVGIVVDRFAGQQEAFIKPLGKPLNRIAGLSGTTVLGSGKTIFLLDVGNLI